MTSSSLVLPIALALHALSAGSVLAQDALSGFPFCTMPGEQRRFVIVPGMVPTGPVGTSTGGMVFWVDGRSAPGDPGDLWMKFLDSSIIFGGVPPVDGNAAVVRAGPQGPLAATAVAPGACPSQWGCTPYVIAYLEPDLVGGDVGHLRAARVLDPLSSWDVAVTPAQRYAWSFAVVRDGSEAGQSGGGALVAWSEFDDLGHPQLRVQHLGPLGERLWGVGGKPVTSTPSWQYGMVMIGAPEGGAFLAWSDLRDGAQSVYAVRLDSLGLPAPGWPADGRRVATGAGNPMRARIAEDGADGLYVLWDESDPDSTGQPATEQPRAVRLLGDGSLAPGWPVSGLHVVDRPGEGLGARDLAADGLGALYVVVVGGSGGGTRSYLQRLLGDGSIPEGWPAAGQPVCTVASDQFEPRLCAVAGVASVVWANRGSGGEIDIQAARFAPDGARPSGWPATGLDVAIAPGEQSFPAIAPGGGGGVVIAWVDGRDPATGLDLWGQVVTYDGRLDAPSAGAPPRLGLALAGAQPARGPVRFRLSLPVGGRVTADVFDLLGRRLGRVEDREFAAGEYLLEWPARGTGDAAGPGIRFLRVRTPAGERSLRFVSLR